jgi:hypothetical protein
MFVGFIRSSAFIRGPSCGALPGAEAAAAVKASRADHLRSSAAHPAGACIAPQTGQATSGSMLRMVFPK